MRWLYILIIICSLVSITVLAGMHMRFQPESDSKVLRLTPAEPKVKLVSKPTPSRSALVREAEQVVEKRVFDPNRGAGEGESKNNPSQPDSEMELAGVFCFGDQQSAIIIIKTLGARQVSRTRLRPGQPPVPTVKKSGTSRKHYKLNDELENGFKLVEIKDNMVVVVKGSDRRELKLDYNDPGSRVRLTVVNEPEKNDTQENPEKPVTPVKPVTPSKPISQPRTETPRRLPPQLDNVKPGRSAPVIRRRTSRRSRTTQ